MAKTTKKTIEVRESQLSRFVFMDKTLAVLEAGIKTGKNVVLYGPGGHGKSEIALEFLLEKGITPYIMTCGAGLTAEKLFGGFDIKEYNESGKLHYLLDNSLFNHEYVILEEMMDAPDYILETLKDSLSSGFYRNGSQVYTIKTRFIIACTNKTRADFSKNDSLKALMERFPLEHNVIWDNYNKLTYNTLLERTFGEGKVDPVIPFILEEYHISGITISPRIALDSYEIYEVCGPNDLTFIADFAKKPEIISEGLKKYEVTMKFEKLGTEMEEIYITLGANKIKTAEDQQAYLEGYKDFVNKITEVESLKVGEESAVAHAGLVKKMTIERDLMTTKHSQVLHLLNPSVVPATPAPKAKKVKSALETYDGVPYPGYYGEEDAPKIDQLKAKRVAKKKAETVREPLWFKE